MPKPSKWIIAVFMAITYCYAFAQRLPSVQQTSLRAPADIKVDGKATEWNNTFQAYNKNTDLYYTISNDDNNLYLTIRATKQRIIQKIIGVGVTFMVSKTGKNDRDKENIMVTFPDIDVKGGMAVLSNAGIRSANIAEGRGRDTITKKATDSVVLIANKLLTSYSKTILIHGVHAIQDSVISVYNEEGIRAASAFDNRSAYTYELALPLKYLELSVDNSGKFYYTIKLRSRLDNKKKGTIVTYKFVGDQQVDANADLDSTTDFWGEYTLAQK